MTDFFNGFGHLCQKFFKIMPSIGNKYNFFMIAVGFTAMIIWLWVQGRYTKEARENGTME
ncbi:MAG: hypothetical protein IT235_07950 [Bacteroidia bacterium]|nr:hypothetical protein [Bacteroidia bacterium]